jgi:predicted metal-dependent enzyme (double-stranded beta helix superfamily)
VICSPGHVDTVSPNTHDVHEVANNHIDQTSISIHVYGANIGKVQRAVYDPSTGQEKTFISGYANTLVPNLWASSQ